MTKQTLAMILLFALRAFSQCVEPGTYAAVPCAAAVTAGESAFKAEQIEPAKLRTLKAADVELSKATVALVAAQGIAKDAKDKYDAAKAEITNQFGAFEGQCSYTGGLGGGSRKYRRVEIRGGYALISEGQEQCPSSSFVLTGGTTWKQQ